MDIQATFASLGFDNLHDIENYRGEPIELTNGIVVAIYISTKHSFVDIRRYLLILLGIISIPTQLFRSL